MLRNITGLELARLLAQFGYRTTRTTGSHQRLTTMREGEHHITVPLHSPLRVGTLAAIVAEIAEHLGLPREELSKRLFA